MPPQEIPDPLARSLERALLTLKTVVGTLKLYPRESPICQQTLHGAHEPIQNILKNVAEVSVNDTGSGLTMDGNKPLQVKGLRELLIVHKIRNLRLFQGVTPSEISTFCEGLGKKPEELAPSPNFNAWLTSKGVRHIHTDEIRYIDIQENEKVVIRGMGEVSGTPGEPGGPVSGKGPGTPSTGDMGPGESGRGSGGAGAPGGSSEFRDFTGGQSVIQVVQQKLSQMTGMTDPALQHDLRDGLVKDLTQMPPEKLQDLFTSKEAEGGTVGEVVQDLVQNLPLNKIEDILRYVAEKHHHIKVQVQSESDRNQRLGLLNTFIKQVLNAPASREIPPALYAYLSSLGLLDNIPGGLKGGQYFSFTAVAKNLLELPAGFLVTVPLCDHVVDLTKTLCADDTEDALPGLIHRVLENLDNFDDTLRRQTMTVLGKLHGVVCNGGKPELAGLLRKRVFQAANAERNLDVYKSAVAALQSVALNELLQLRFEEVAQIMAQFRRHSQETFALPQGRFEQARIGIQLFAKRASDALCSDLYQAERQAGALKVLVQLGEEAVDPLLISLRHATDPRAQQAILQGMEAIGLGSQKCLLEQLQLNAGPKELLQVIGLILPFVKGTMLSRFAPLLQHPSGMVRREVVLVLARMNDPNVPGLITPLINDPDPHVQQAVIRFIGEFHPHNAAPMLLAKRSRVTGVLLEEVCMALGKIAHPDAIPALIECVNGHSGFWSKKPLYEEAVRVRAVSALAPFLTYPKVKKTIEEAAKDDNPLVRQTALQVLRPAA